VPTEYFHAVFTELVFPVVLLMTVQPDAVVGAVALARIAIETISEPNGGVAKSVQDVPAFGVQLVTTAMAEAAPAGDTHNARSRIRVFI
jgi:hypothetical protein